MTKIDLPAGENLFGAALAAGRPAAVVLALEIHNFEEDENPLHMTIFDRVHMTSV